MAGAIKGGVSAVLDPLAGYIKAHGGEIRLNSPVESVIIKNGKAAGVNIEKGDRLFHSQVMDVEQIEAEYVIAAAQLWEIFSLLN